MQLKLVTPEKLLLQENITKVSVPTNRGEITILPHHIELVCTISHGELKVTTETGKSFEIAIFGGFMHVDKDGHVNILADSAMRLNEISDNAMNDALLRAKEKLNDPKLSEQEYAKVFASLEKAMIGMRLARKHARRKNNPITSEGVMEE